MFKKFLSIFHKEQEVVPLDDKAIEDLQKEQNAMSEYVGDGSVCPLCGSTDTRTIQYGLVRFDSDERRDEFKKTHILGGCVTYDNSPQFYCNSCHKRFGKENSHLMKESV